MDAAWSLVPHGAKGLARGAGLTPAGGPVQSHILMAMQAQGWGHLCEVEEPCLFLLAVPPHAIGEIIHVDACPHLD
jgi:hypothetical protein